MPRRATPRHTIPHRLLSSNKPLRILDRPPRRTVIYRSVHRHPCFEYTIMIPFNILRHDEPCGGEEKASRWTSGWQRPQRTTRQGHVTNSEHTELGRLLHMMKCSEECTGAFSGVFGLGISIQGSVSRLRLGLCIAYMHILATRGIASPSDEVEGCCG